MKPRAQHCDGFSLVEVTLALGVAAFALLAIFGLLPVGQQTSRIAIDQTGAAGVLTAIASDLRATPSTATTSPLFGVPIPAAGGAGSTTFYVTERGGHSAAVANDSRYQATVTFYTNPAGPNAVAFANIMITWPAAAAPANAAGSAECFVALDR